MMSKEVALTPPPRVPVLAWWALACATAAVPAVLVDLPLASLCRGDVRRVGGDLRKFVDLMEVFGHGAGVAMILVAALVLDFANWRRVAWVGACAFGAGLAADVFKLGLARARPKAFDFDGSIWSSFGSWFPTLASDDFWRTLRDHDQQSFPSAHTATAVGLAAGLSWLYPRGRFLFTALACLVALQRVFSQSHWPSDTLAGAALGCAVAAALLAARPKWVDGDFENAIANMPRPKSTNTGSAAPPGRRRKRRRDRRR